MKIASLYRNSLLILISISLIQWFILFQDLNPTWDAAFYYAYARSLAFDGDLEIRNDLLLNYPSASDDFVAKGMEQVQTATGQVYTPFAIGSALIWTPWLVVLRLLYPTGAFLGLNGGNPTGYEPFFTVSISFLSALLAFLGFLFSFRIARDETDNFCSLAAVITFLFATPLIYYQFREPLYSHATAVFVTSTTVFVWWKSYSELPRYTQAIGLGTIIGIATIVRWQHIIYIVLPLISTIWWWSTLSAKDRRVRWRRALAYLGIICLFWGLIFSVQLAHWKITFGSWLIIPQGSSFLDWRAPFIQSFLFSSFRGILPWMPVALLGILGLVVLARRNLRLALPLLLVLILDIYINSSVRDWFAGGGYGPRRFTSDLIILILGYASLISFLPKRIRKPSAAMLAIFFLMHQLLLLRYGIAGRIGGRVQTMQPSFEWAEERYITFLSSITGHIPEVIQDPIDFFIHRRSPLNILLSGQIPKAHFVSLILTITFITSIWFVFNRLNKRDISMPRVTMLLAAFLIMAVLLLDLFILFQA